jgi:hypothetical protein
MAGMREDDETFLAFGAGGDGLAALIFMLHSSFCLQPKSVGLAAPKRSGRRVRLPNQFHLGMADGGMVAFEFPGYRSPRRWRVLR